MKDIMFDIETLGTSYNSIVIQVAMVYFDRRTKEKGESLVVNIDPIDANKYGLIYDEKTVDWWDKKPEEVKQSVFSNQIPLKEALTKINKFLKFGSIIWCHATFDMPILSNAFNKTGIKPNWHYMNFRDIRTIVDLSGINLNNYKWDEGKTHNALDDCNFQIDYSVDCINKLLGDKDELPNN